MILAEFADIIEVVDITQVCAGIIGVLTVAVGAILAVQLGMALLRGLMSWLGVTRSRVD